MKLNVLIIVILFFIAFNSSAKDSWSFTIKGSLLECSGHEDEHYWLCEGEIYSGLIYKDPENKEAQFLPLLMSKEGLELDLSFESWTNKFKESFITEGENPSCNYTDYLEFDTKKFEEHLEDFAKNTKLPEHRDKIIAQGKRFLSLIRIFLTDLPNLSMQQELFEDGPDIFSWFLLKEPRQPKKPEEVIYCYGINDLSIENREHYEQVISSTGRIVTLEEAEELFKEASERTDMVFDCGEGCYARAHILASDFHSKGICTGKIWLVGQLWNPNPPYQEWNYHVAPTIQVETPNGIILMVVDPSVDKKQLLSLSDWLKKFSITKIKQVSYPIPEKARLFEDVVMAFSSHVPYSPFHYNSEYSMAENLEEAHAINTKLLELFNNP